MTRIIHEKLGKLLGQEFSLGLFVESVRVGVMKLHR